MADVKTTLNDGDVQAFIDAVEDDTRREDCRAVTAMMAELTGEPPKMWGSSIIGFGTYHSVYASGREADWMRVGLSPRKRELTLYIMPGFGAYDELLTRLGPHRTGKSCLYIKRLADVDQGALRTLISASLEAMRAKYPED